MGGVPGRRGGKRVGPKAIVVADHGRALRAAERPVTAHLVSRLGTIGIGARQNIVLVRLIASAFYDFALPGEAVLLVHRVGIAAERGDIVCDLDAFCIEPWSRADAVLGIFRARREMGAPGLAGDPGGFRQTCAMRVGPCNTAEIRVLARVGAGDEETYRGVLCTGCPDHRGQCGR